MIGFDLYLHFFFLKDPKKREELCEELVFSETKARRRSLGNIRYKDICRVFCFFK